MQVPGYHFTHVFLEYVQGGSVVQFYDDVALAGSDDVPRGKRCAALGMAGRHGHLAGKQYTGYTAGHDRIGYLYVHVPGRAQTAHEKSIGYRLRQCRDQGRYLQVDGVAMEDAEIKFIVFKPIAGTLDEVVYLPGLYRQGPERGIGKICEHDSQGRLIIIFLPGGAHAQADTAGPVCDAGTLPQCIQYNVELWYEGIGGVDKTEVRRVGDLADLVQAVFNQLSGRLVAAVS